jgi:enoyl-CoA hydratase/carnithine racemase
MSIGDSTSLGLPAVHEGLFPGLATARLPRLIGLGPARRLAAWRARSPARYR